MADTFEDDLGILFKGWMQGARQGDGAAARWTDGAQLV
jgi:hypothetical protein